MVTGYLAAFGFVFLLIIGIYCFGYAARKSSLLYVLLLETALGVLLIFPLLFLEKDFTLQHVFTGLPLTNLGWLAASALLGYAGGNYFTLLNLRTAGEKVNSLLSPAITAFTIVLGYFVFGERLHAGQWAGTVLTLVVVVYFLWGQKKQVQIEDGKAGLWSGIATVACMSLSIVGSIKGATGVDAYLHAVWLRLFFALLIVTASFIVAGAYKKVKPQSTKFYVMVLTAVVAQTMVASYLWLYASFAIGISAVQVIIATLPLWVYAVDVYLLKKSKPSQAFILTSVLAFIGIILVML